MARNYVAEIESLRTRSASNLWVASFEVSTLRGAWADRTGMGTRRSDLFVIRPVTILEVTTRAWIAALIDYDDPYVSRASELSKRSGGKLDFGTAQALTRERITLGELIAHTLYQLNRRH